MPLGFDTVSVSVNNYTTHFAADERMFESRGVPAGLARAAPASSAPDEAAIGPRPPWIG